MSKKAKHHEKGQTPGSVASGRSAEITRAARIQVCNGLLIKFWRNHFGWTQIDLAVRAGFSRRLIAKAEAGGSLELETVEIIAATFREAGADVSVADFLCDPEAMTRRLLKNYATYEGNWVTNSLDILSPDIVAILDGDPATNPLAGEYHGIEEFDGLWKKFFSMFARSGGTLGDDPTIRCNGNEVLAWGHEFVHLPELPPVEPGFVMLRLTFKDGKIIRFEDFYEAAGMMHAMYRFADQFPDAEWAKQLREKASTKPTNIAPTPSVQACEAILTPLQSDSPPSTVDSER
jgi:transcriptional regulator with XRE-family HTH domain